MEEYFKAKSLLFASLREEEGQDKDNNQHG